MPSSLNKSRFTRIRRLLHDIEREIDENLNDSFISYSDRKIFEDVSMQVSYCLEVTRDILL